MKKINDINQVLSEYFEHNKSVQRVPVGFMMSYFVLAGIYKKDDSKGTSLKNFLRNLEEKNQLHRIPFAKVVQKNISKKWFFERAVYKPTSLEPKKAKTKTKKIPFKKSDAFYVLELCNKVLLSKFEVSKKGFIVNQKDFSDAILTIHADGFYADLKLAIKFFDATQKNTLKPKQFFFVENALFEEKEFHLIFISYKKLSHHASGTLKRIIREDLEILRAILEPFYPKTTLF